MKMNINKQSVGFRIKQIRLRKGYTLEAFGKLFNTSKSNVLRWEQGISLPNKERIKDICKVADLTVNELVYGSVGEFLDNNIDALLENSDYPIKLTNSKLHISYRQSFNNYINTRLQGYPLFKEGLNPIENIDLLCGVVISFINEYIQQEINDIYSVVTQYRDTTKVVLVFFPTDIDVKTFNISENIINVFSSYDNLVDYLTRMDNTDVANNYLLLKELHSKIIEIVKNEKLNLEERRTLYISLSDVLSNNTDLYTLKNIGSNPLFKSNTFMQNKYDFYNYFMAIGLKVEKENSLFYLASYIKVDDVPINTDADYFILNHDNTYQITKITEIPDCKYISPIIGKLE